MKPLLFGQRNTITWLFRFLLALVLATALPMVISCTGGGDPLSQNTPDPNEDPDYEPPGVPSNIILASTAPSPAVIGISGAGGVESIIITFQIVDVNNEAVSGDHTVNFEILHGGLNGGEKLNNLSDVTEIREETVGEDTIKYAEVKTVFNSGSEAGTVQVRASLDSDPSILADVTVSITGGLPSGNAFGLSVGPLNINGLMLFGLVQEVRADISDYFSNPVAPNITVNFQTDYSSITGTGTFVNTGETSSNASVFMGTLTSGPPPAEDGFVTIEAETRGGNHSKILSLAIRPDDENTIFAGMDGGGIFKTTDGGTSWDLVGSPLKDLGAAKFSNLTGTIVRDILIDPNDPEVVYAATDTDIFVSTNAGEGWKSLTGRNRETGDLLGSTDGSGYDANGLSVQCFPFTFDNTGNRARMDVLLDQVATTDYIESACNGIDGIRLFTPWSGRFFSYSLTAGQTVEADYDSDSSASGPFYAVVIDPSVDNFDSQLGHAKIIYAGSYGNGVWKTSDAGRHWKRVSTMAPGQGVTFSEKVISLAVNDAQPNEIFCGSDGKGLYKSTDGAASWYKVTGSLQFPINETEVRDIVVEPVAGGSTNVWIAGKNGIHYSNDGGTTWKTPETRLSANDPINTDVRVLARDTIDGTLYAASFGDVLDRAEPHGGVYSSADGGVNWSKVSDLGTSSGAHTIDSLAVFGKADSNDVIVAGSEGRTVFRSNNSGTQWTTINGDAPTNITNTLFSSFTALHSGDAFISFVPYFGSMHGYGDLADHVYTHSIYNGEYASFYIQVSDQNGNRLVADTNIKISVSAGSGSEIDITLADGTYGGTDYYVSWTNDLEEEGEVGDLTIEVDGEPYGSHKFVYSYYLHGFFGVSPSSIELSLAADADSGSEAISSVGGSDQHSFTTTSNRGSVANNIYTYDARFLAPGGSDTDTIIVTDDGTGATRSITVTITKAEAAAEE